MYLTLPIKDVGILLIIIALLVLFVYLIKLFKNLIVTVQKTNEVLDDVKVMTEIAEKRSRDLDAMVDNVSGSVESITAALKGQETLMKQLSQIMAAVSSLVGVVKGRKNN